MGENNEENKNLGLDNTETGNESTPGNENNNENQNPAGDTNISNEGEQGTDTPNGDNTNTDEEAKVIYTIILRHDILENWMLNDPILVNGEYAVEDDTHKVKRGDGLSKWSELPYETFGIETLIIKEAKDIAYDNTKSELLQTNVQDVIDYILNNISSDNVVKTLQAQIDELKKEVTALKPGDKTEDKIETGNDNTGTGLKDPDESETIPVG